MEIAIAFYVQLELIFNFFNGRMHMK